MTLFDCELQATSGHARALSYETAHGSFQTPMFMPVGTCLLYTSPSPRD